MKVSERDERIDLASDSNQLPPCLICGMQGAVALTYGIEGDFTVALCFTCIEHAFAKALADKIDQQDDQEIEAG